MFLRSLPLAAAALCLAALPLQAAPPKKAAGVACPKLYPNGVIPFTGLYPAIEGKLPLKTFEKNQIVEIDFVTMPEDEFKAYVTALQGLPVRVSFYLPGGHCNIENNDCAALEKAGVKRFGTTGSWNWDKDEKRILDITHPASIARILKGAERGWRLGANYVRVDNLHSPAGSAEPRTAEQLKAIFEAILDLEDRLRAEGVIKPDQVTGYVAHNNFEEWEKLIASGALRRPPVFLTSERTAQLAYKGEGYKGDRAMKAGKLKPSDVGEILAAGRIARKLGIPYTVAEFKISHDLSGKKDTTYTLPDAYVDALATMPGVSDVIVIPSETHYIGRGKPRAGSGPKTLSASSWPDDAGKIAKACMAAD